jgi:hypothetical protein
LGVKRVVAGDWRGGVDSDSPSNVPYTESEVVSFVTFNLTAPVVGTCRRRIYMSNVAAALESQTLRDLLAACQGESNASIKYSAFAITAEVDGFVRAAALFRAAARAEQVHAVR